MNQTMKAHELEAWVLEIVDRVHAKQPVEDSRVELKAEWPSEPNRAARRLAGHCNAMHGEPVLWVIGLDEKRGVVGAGHREVPEWFGQVGKQFDGVVPELMRDLNVPVGNSTVVGLLFNTDRVPFVVKNPIHGPVDREVPWREGTAVRSAKREDLLRLLVPLQRLPDVSVLSITFFTILGPVEKLTDPEHDQNCRLFAELYVTPNARNELVIPFHQCEARVSLGPGGRSLHLGTISAGPRVRKYRRGNEPIFPVDNRLSRTIDATPTEVVISGPGLVQFTADGVLSEVDQWRGQRGAYSIMLRPAGSERSISLAGDLSPKADHDSHQAVWVSRV